MNQRGIRFESSQNPFVTTPKKPQKTAILKMGIIASELRIQFVLVFLKIFCVIQTFYKDRYFSMSYMPTSIIS